MNQAAPTPNLSPYEVPQPTWHLHTHWLQVASIPPREPLASAPVVLPNGAALVVLAHLAWSLQPQQSRELDMEAFAPAWAQTLPPHLSADAVQPQWVHGYPLAPVPCVRWPLLRAFLQAWASGPGGQPSQRGQQLLDALAQDAQQLDPDLLASQAPARRPPKIDGDTVRQLHQLRTSGKTRMEAATALNIGMSTCKEIEAGRYPFATITAKDAWRDTFGTQATAPANGLNSV